mmetsp:Transcript_39899/g.120096  ORF Transcript_39899/g.120096 Transcript_39899/m.120096 type:complete len:286 (+) Transcript_39899:424-1281(+)
MQSEGRRRKCPRRRRRRPIRPSLPPVLRRRRGQRRRLLLLPHLVPLPLPVVPPVLRRLPRERSPRPPVGCPAAPPVLRESPPPPQDRHHHRGGAVRRRTDSRDRGRHPRHRWHRRCRQAVREGPPAGRQRVVLRRRDVGGHRRAGEEGQVHLPPPGDGGGKRRKRRRRGRRRWGGRGVGRRLAHRGGAGSPKPPGRVRFGRVPVHPGHAVRGGRVDRGQPSPGGIRPPLGEGSPDRDTPPRINGCGAIHGAGVGGAGRHGGVGESVPPGSGGSRDRGRGRCLAEC